MDRKNSSAYCCSIWASRVAIDPGPAVACVERAAVVLLLVTPLGSAGHDGGGGGGSDSEVVPRPDE